MRSVGGSLLGMLLLVTPAMAQAADRIDLKGVVGTTGFVDSPTNYHLAMGGAVRVPLFRALSVEPEFLYMRGSSLHDDLSFQAAAIWGFRPGSGFRPYLIAGGRSASQSLQVPRCPRRAVLLERVHGSERSTIQRSLTPPFPHSNTIS